MKPKSIILAFIIIAMIVLPVQATERIIHDAEYYVLESMGTVIDRLPYGELP